MKSKKGRNSKARKKNNQRVNKTDLDTNLSHFSLVGLIFSTKSGKFILDSIMDHLQAENLTIGGLLQTIGIHIQLCVSIDSTNLSIKMIDLKFQSDKYLNSNSLQSNIL